MNRKTMLGAAACAVLTFGLSALALAGVGQGAVGRGVVRSEDGRAGEFQFKAHKAIGNVGGNEIVRVTGTATFRTVLPDQTALGIDCKFVRFFTLGDDKRSAEFSGPATLHRRTAQGVTMVPGTLAWRVVDRGRPGPNNPPDIVGVLFQPADGSAAIELHGLVGLGDVRVFEVSDTRP